MNLNLTYKISLANCVIPNNHIGDGVPHEQPCSMTCNTVLSQLHYLDEFHHHSNPVCSLITYFDSSKNPYVYGN